MAFPLLPFVAGAVVGGLATYLYENRQARTQIKKTAGDVTDKVKQTAGAVTQKMSKGDISSPHKESDDKDKDAAEPLVIESTESAETIPSPKDD